MEDSEALEECIVKVENEIKVEGENVVDELESRHLPVGVRIECVKQEEETQDKISQHPQVIVNALKEEMSSDEDELEPPAKVTVEDFKEEVEGFYANILPAGATVATSASISRPPTGLQLQWKQQGAVPELSAQITSNENWGNSKGCVAITQPSAGSSWVPTDAQNVPDGTLVKDGNVYVLVTAPDSFFVVESPENNSVCPSDGSIKNLISGDKNMQVISIVPNQSTASGDVVIRSIAEDEPGSAREPESEEKNIVIPASSSNKRSGEQVITFSTGIQAEACDMLHVSKKKKKIENHMVMMEEEDSTVKKGCDVNSCAMRCSVTFDENERIEINRAFHSLSVDVQKKFVLQSCSRKIFLKDVKGLDGSNRTTTHFKYDFHLKSMKGISVQVCKLFFASTLGFNDSYFNCYLSDLYKNSGNSVCSVVKNSSTVCSVVTRCTCPGGTNQRNRGRPSSAKWFGSCRLHSDVYGHTHKDLFHNHIESFLRTLCVPQGEHVRTIRYLPKDVSIEMMHQDFARKHPEVNSTYELYKSFVVHFTS